MKSKGIRIATAEDGTKKTLRNCREPKDPAPMNPPFHYEEKQK